MSALLPMTEAEYSAYLGEAIPAYAADKVASGQWSQAEALALSQQGFAELCLRARRLRTTTCLPSGTPRAARSA